MTATSIETAVTGVSSRPRSRVVRVFMMDLLSIVPYYSGHLCAGLAQVEGVRVTLGSITYQHDRGFFRRQALRTDPGLLDLTWRLTAAPALVRRALKTAESLVNLAVLALRFTVSRPDIIHVQFVPLVNYGLPAELWFLRFAQTLGIKLVYTVHNVLPQGTGGRYKDRFRQIYEMADRLICHDATAAGRLTGEFGVDPGRISVIPHGPLFDNTQHSPAGSRSRLGFAGDECVVLWQGILRPYKGVSFLLKAWRKVLDSGLQARLAIVGTGEPELIRAVEEEVTALGLGESVRCDMRFVSVEELADYYQGADILVYPYGEITTSGALMTGIGYGKAIVATSLPAFTRILTDGEDALLVPYGDVGQLARSLSRLISDPPLRRRLGAHLAERRIGAPRWPDISRQTMECYESALAPEPVK